VCTGHDAGRIQNESACIGPDERRGRSARVSQGWLDQPERGSVIGIRLIVGLALLLGRRVARVLLIPVCVYFLLFSVKARAASRKYLGRVLGRDARIADLFRHYFTFATVALDRFFLLKDRYELFSTEVHGQNLLDEVLARGQGCLLLGAHLGSFEILRALGTEHHIEVGLVMYEDNAKMVNTVAKAINPALADLVIPLGRFDSMFKVYERLQASAWVGVLGDRALDEEGQVRVPFLGEAADFPSAPFRIALMLKRPVVLMAGLYRGGNRYELHFEKLFDPEGIERSARAGAIEDAVRAYAGRLGHYCRSAPYNWFNFYDFWNGSSH
jgi:predicted LPLAT superfamily acyltransferase